MDDAAQKRKRQAKNRRRADKKRAKKNALYGRAPVAKALGTTQEGSDSDSVASDLNEHVETVKEVGTEKKVAAGSKSGKSALKAALTKKKKNLANSKSKSTATSQLAGAKEVQAICDSTPGDFRLAGERALQWIIGSGMPVETFMSEYYETKPLLVRRNKTGQSNYFDGLLTQSDIEEALQKGKLKHNRDFSLTAYRNGKRETLKHDTEAVAKAKEVMALFGETQGASIRLLRPQELSEPIWKLVTLMEGFFNCGGGANSYLTPKGSQGFAPHYDDIDAFILQLEGAKEWTVYHHYESKKKDDDDDEEEEDEEDEEGDEEDEEDEEDEDDPDELFPRNPRYSSKDFTEEQVKKHLKVAIHTTLEPGDMLYVPRGMVHHAKSKLRDHSLHVTLSVGQLNTWADFIREALPQAIQKSCLNDTTSECEPLRRNLPRELNEYMGVINSDDHTDPRRRQFVAEMLRLISEHVLQNIDFDLIADQMGVQFQHNRHRPIGVLPLPQAASLETDKDGAPVEVPDEEIDSIDANTQVVLVAKGVATLTVEGDKALFYHSCRNTRTYHETDTRGLEFGVEDAETLEWILRSDPTTPFTIGKLPKHPFDKEDTLRIVRFLVSENVLSLCD